MTGVRIYVPTIVYRHPGMTTDTVVPMGPRRPPVPAPRRTA